MPRQLLKGRQPGNQMGWWPLKVTGLGKSQQDPNSLEEIRELVEVQTSTWASGGEAGVGILRSKILTL